MIDSFYFVRMKGLEPPLLSKPDPKSGAATNYATSAFFLKRVCKDMIFLKEIKQIFSIIYLMKIIEG